MVDFTRVILAGGHSRRMGRDKALLPLGGRPLLAHVLESTDPLRPTATLLVTNSAEAHGVFGLAMVGDVFAGCGALGGIHAGLSAMRTPWALVVACDMPTLSARLLAYQLEIASASNAEAVVPRVDGRPQNLHTVIHQRALAEIAARLTRGDLKMSGLFAAIHTHWVDEADWQRFDADGRSFANLNTPDDLPALP